MIAIRDAEKCTGCKACELACSYHHRQIFCPSIASICINRNEADAKVDILHYRQAEDKHLPCDCTKGSEFCLVFCTGNAREELRSILEREVDE